MATKRPRLPKIKVKHPFQTCRTTLFNNQLLRLYKLETRAIRSADRYFPRGRTVLVLLRSDEDEPLEAEIVTRCSPITDGVVVKFKRPPKADLEGEIVIPWFYVYLPTDWALRKELRERRGWTYEEPKPKRKRRKKGAA